MVDSTPDEYVYECEFGHRSVSKHPTMDACSWPTKHPDAVGPCGGEIDSRIMDYDPNPFDLAARLVEAEATIERLQVWGDMAVSSADLRIVLDHLPLSGRPIPDGAHDRLRWLLNTGKSTIVTTPPVDGEQPHE